jgi:hydrogenase-4 transcriptional activator
VSGTADILGSYVRLLGRLTGAGAVSLYVPSAAAGEREILVHEGALPPVPELADTQAAAEFQRRMDTAPSDESDGPVVSSTDADGVLYRVPMQWLIARQEEPASERRKGGRRRAEPDVWIGLRFEGLEALTHARGMDIPWESNAFADDRWLKAFLGLGAAFALHTRTVSRRLFDQVTGLPERREFQAELEASLAHGLSTGRPVVLLLLGPDDFAWVNDRVDRRSGDSVLREIATGLRSAVRSEDHVARYGGAIFTVVLRDTGVEDGRFVAENLVRRLTEKHYHQGRFRLGFSVGLASTEDVDSIDAQGLIRRSDQALSAAKRGQGGSVRVWEKGSDVEHAGSLDRLQGIFTGDKSKDYRNMRLLLDTVTAVAASTDPAELARSFTTRLCATVHARRSAVLEYVRDGSFGLLAGMESAAGAARDFELTPHDVALVEQACRERAVVSRPAGEGGEAAAFAVPLFLQDRCLGGILLEVNEVSVPLEGSDRRFLDALASEMAVALDRARLIERDRERERVEKERLQTEVDDLRRVLHRSRFAYRSSVMESLLATVRRAARTDTTVLITGESGTGKELLAHTLHELSARHERPVVVVDCSAISPTLIESELFGHEKGAFTGAHTRNPGRLVQAHGSTVFLDEVGDLPLDLQSKLLRFVQERQFTPVGGVSLRRVDARIVAATNVDLRLRVAAGRFRADLFHRLNVVRLHVPPLRERKEDIAHLANMFLQQFAALYRRPAHHFTPAAEKALEEYEWPGNVRELQNLVLSSVLFCDAPAVDVGDLQAFQAAPTAANSPDAAVFGPDASDGAVSGRGGPTGDPIAQLRKTLGEEIALALRSGRMPVPLGKWLTEDLVLAADRLAGGTHRRAAVLLGIPETTYRRQLQTALGRRAAGLQVRSATWPAVANVLVNLVRSRPPGRDACVLAEELLLAEIEAAVPGDLRLAAALVGVAEATLLRRRALIRQF